MPFWDSFVSFSPVFVPFSMGFVHLDKNWDLRLSNKKTSMILFVIFGQTLRKKERLEPKLD
ncbi:hypothetical protein J7E63_25780 [Bacillus sp. ISL-75]|uniref:hypothetical protein n=1 Tax=Bacillus sp. ISL-75 TaxID=2819137 RepID=UPI001BE55B6C|nr:hypothetical protein [Bacillus sp. ISL-75]MBT2730258.1 hypothetical protein [Bacillus sp. ISL-75]